MLKKRQKKIRRSRRKNILRLPTPAEIRRKRDPQKLGCLCKECPLKHRPPVFAKVSKTPAVMAIIGEAPGANEEREGEFFVGASGREITKACAEFNIPRKSLHINNALLCRPDKKMSPEEWTKAVTACRPRLQKELRRSKAKMALVVGKQALRSTTGKASMLDWMGATLAAATLDIKGFQVLPTWHPAFCLRKPANWVTFYTHFVRAWELATGRQKPWKWPKIVIEPDKTMVAALRRLVRTTKGKVLGVDVETAGASPIAPLTAVGVASKTLGVSIPWPPERFAVASVAAEIREELKNLLEDETIEKAAHNGAHDMIAFRAQGWKVEGYRWDTMLMHGVAASALKHDLGFVSVSELHCDRWKTLYNVRSDLKGSEKWVKALDTEGRRRALCEYNGRDSVILPHLVPKLKRRLVRETYRGMELYQGYFERSMIAVKMRERGVLVNKTALLKHRKSLGERRRRALREFRKLIKSTRYVPAKMLKERQAAKRGALPLTAMTFNPNSKDQINDLFFRHLKVAPTRWSEKTGKPSLDVKALQGLIIHPKIQVAMAARLLLTYRRWHKLLSTYVLRTHPNHPKSYAGRDWILHPDARVQGTRSGRWSYKEPNLQNVPKPKFRKGAKGKFILEAPGMRDIIRARPGNYILEADYSQLELRILALLAGDKVLLDWYAKGVDVHTANAKQLFYTDKPTKMLRDLSKRGVYGLNYGGDEQTVWQSLVVDFPSLSLLDVARFKERWYFLHPRIKLWQRVNLKIARERDYVECPLSGRRQYFFGQVEATKVYNTPIQGSGADIIDAAIGGVAGDVDWDKGEALIAQIHDALIVEGPDPVRLATILKRYMEQSVILNGEKCIFPIDYKLGVMHEVETKKGVEWVSDWGNCKGFDTIPELDEYLKGTKYEKKLQRKQATRRRPTARKAV